MCKNTYGILATVVIPLHSNDNAFYILWMSIEPRMIARMTWCLPVTCIAGVKDNVRKTSEEPVKHNLKSLGLEKELA